MFEAESLTGVFEGEGFVAGSVVGHDPLDGDAEAFVVGDGGLEEGDGADGFLVGQDLGEGDPGVVVDGDMDELPALVAAASLAGSVARDAMADLFETTEFFDVDVDLYRVCVRMCVTVRVLHSHLIGCE